MQQNFVSDLLKRPAWMLFLISWLFYLIGLILFSQFVWDANTYMADFKGTDFETSLSNWRRMDMLLYVISPVWVIGISAIVWIVIKLGLAITQVEFNTSLLFKIIFLGSIIIFLPNWVKSVGLILFKSGYTPDDVTHFFPGSIVPFIETSNMSEVKMKALATINIYHLAFIFFTSWQIAANSKITFIKSLLIVICTYGLGLVLLQYIKLLFLE
ncbi:MAG: hypothetical protein PHP53_23430 [Prolixibacteraceae bacterium]|nr:hypothetical protein [Prolixibacteraceae bacterium]